MTNLAVTSKPAFVMLDNTKGSVKNRAKCVGEQFINTNITLAATAGTLGGAYMIANHPEKIAEFVNTTKATVAPYATKLANSTAGKKALELLGKAKNSNMGQQALGFIGKLQAKAAPVMKELVSDMTKAGTKLAGFAKAHPLLAASTAVILGVIGLNHAFKAGQIDQKYTDKAKYENA